jgi:hypothetical protein
MVNLSNRTKEKKISGKAEDMSTLTLSVTNIILSLLHKRLDIDWNHTHRDPPNVVKKYLSCIGKSICNSNVFIFWLSV